jgi:hypothetical protein
MCLAATDPPRQRPSAPPSSHSPCHPALLLTPTHLRLTPHSPSIPHTCAQVRPEEVELIRRDYTANGGWETFLEYGDPRQDILVGLVRLRKVAGPDSERQPQLRGSCSIVRELHVYGTAVAVHSRDASKFQHQVGRCGCLAAWLAGGLGVRA